jgi:hypothetical protein
MTSGLVSKERAIPAFAPFFRRWGGGEKERSLSESKDLKVDEVLQTRALPKYLYNGAMLTESTYSSKIHHNLKDLVFEDVILKKDTLDAKEHDLRQRFETVTQDSYPIPEKNVDILETMYFLTQYLQEMGSQLGSVPPHHKVIIQLFQGLKAIHRLNLVIGRKFGLFPLLHKVNWNYPSNIPELQNCSSLEIQNGLIPIRYAYNFCPLTASCQKYPQCNLHHYVFDRVNGDVMSVIECVQLLLLLWKMEHPQFESLKKNVKKETHLSEKRSYYEISRTLNTLSYVVSHMYNELRGRETLGLYKRTLDLSHKLPNRKIIGDNPEKIVEKINLNKSPAFITQAPIFERQNEIKEKTNRDSVISSKNPYDALLASKEEAE